MNLIKTSIFSGVSTIIKVITGFIITKLIALYVGAPGLAIIGQLRNFSTIVMTFSNGGISHGIIKYTAEYQDDLNEKKKLFSSSLIISIVFGILLGTLLFVFSNQLAEIILKDAKYDTVFKLFAFTVIFFSLNTLLVSILNGQKEIRKYIWINILSSLTSLVFTTFLVVKLQLLGVLYAIVLNQSIIFFITSIFIIRCKWFSMKDFLLGIDKESLIKLAKFALMALTAGFTLPFSLLIIRNYIGNNLSWDDAGYWEGMWRISETYLMVIIMSLTVYYLPRLSEIKEKKKLKKEILHVYKIIMPVVILLAFGIFVFRKYAILILFTEKFMPMIKLFKWQLIGDVIKIASWLLGMVMVAKAMTRTFIATEVIFSALFVILSILFIKNFGLIGVTYAFSLNYFLYLITMIFVLKRKLNE